MTRRILWYVVQVAAAVLIIGVNQALAQGIDIGPLNTLVQNVGCAVYRFGPYLAFLFFLIGAALVISGSRGVTYIAYALFGLAVVAAAPRIMNSITSLFGFGTSFACQ